MDIEVDCAAVLKKAMSRGGEFADVFIERSAPFSILCEDGRIEKVISGVETGAGVRLIVGRRTAYAYTNDLRTEALLELADAVRQAAAGEASSVGINLSRKIPRVDFRIQKAPESISVQDKVSIVLQANKIARIRSPNQAGHGHVS